MIKIATTIILILVTLIASAQTGKTTTTEVEVGRGVNCIGGAGRCITNGEGNKISNSTFFKVTKENLTLINLSIITEDLSITNQKNLFGKELSLFKESEPIYFYQPEDYILEDENLEKWQTTREYPLIKKGYYPVSVKEDILHIYITLSK